VSIIKYIIIIIIYFAIESQKKKVKMSNEYEQTKKDNGGDALWLYFEFKRYQRRQSLASRERLRRSSPCSLNEIRQLISATTTQHITTTRRSDRKLTRLVPAQHSSAVLTATRSFSQIDTPQNRFRKCHSSVASLPHIQIEVVNEHDNNTTNYAHSKVTNERESSELLVVPSADNGGNSSHTRESPRQHCRYRSLAILLPVDWSVQRRSPSHVISRSVSFNFAPSPQT
jgi:hypothetical protein